MEMGSSLIERREIAKISDILPHQLYIKLVWGYTRFHMNTPEHGEKGEVENAAQTYEELLRAKKTWGMLDKEGHEEMMKRLAVARAALSKETADLIDAKFAKL
jgi:hypothetical protein